jgi:hypothetical protein
MRWGAVVLIVAAGAATIAASQSPAAVPSLIP